MYEQLNQLKKELTEEMTTSQTEYRMISEKDGITIFEEIASGKEKFLNPITYWLDDDENGFEYALPVEVEEDIETLYLGNFKKIVINHQQQLVFVVKYFLDEGNEVDYAWVESKNFYQFLAK